jgi:hypothetical protein
MTASASRPAAKRSRRPIQIELLWGISLAQAFRSFVLNDPRMRRLASRAIAVEKEYERVFHEGRCYVHGAREWPFCIEGRGLVGVFRDESDDGPVGYISASRSSTPVIRAADALIARYGELVSILRTSIDCVGLSTKTGEREQIPKSIFAHRDFRFDAQTGDIVQLQDDALSFEGLFKRRWIAVELQKSIPLHDGKVTEAAHNSETPSQGSPPKPKVKQDLVARAFAALWPNRDFHSLTVTLRNRRIHQWLKEKELGAVSDKSIQRFFRSSSGM